MYLGKVFPVRIYFFRKNLREKFLENLAKKFSRKKITGKNLSKKDFRKKNYRKSISRLFCYYEKIIRNDVKMLVSKKDSRT